MFTAKVIKKEETQRGLLITVEFTNGTKTITEDVLPQDKAGFNHWLSARLSSLQAGEELRTELADGAAVTVPTPIIPTKTAQQIWQDKYYKLVRVKQTLVDTGVIPTSNARYVALQDEVRTGLQANPDFFNAI